MIQIAGLYWPDDVADKWRHSWTHVLSLETSLSLCRQHRTAVQAGGNIGLWPRRMADVFSRVITFEPEPISRACLAWNTRNTMHPVDVRCQALGAEPGVCAISRKSLGSHAVIEGDSVSMTTVDALRLDDLDLLQLDVEGYEWHALSGAAATVQRCHPVIQVELRGFVAKYGQTDEAIRALLQRWGYREHSKQRGSDVVFTWG